MNKLLAASLLFSIGDELRNGHPEGGAWTVGSQKLLAVGLFSGAVMAGAYLVVSSLFAPPEITLGPLAEMAVTPGKPQLMWIILSVLIAPFIEELLFRGVIFGGLCRFWGVLWAAIVSTAVFVLLHITEMIHFWPSAIFITAMALTALCLRLKAEAIGPAVAVHFAYNGILVIAVTISTLS